MRENSIYMLYCGSCADSVKIRLVSSASSTGERLKSGDAFIIAPPLAVCLSTIYNELNTACNRRMIVKQTKERGYIMYFNFQYKVIIRKDKQSKITGYKFAESEKIAAVICERLNSLGLYAIYCKY